MGFQQLNNDWTILSLWEHSHFSVSTVVPTGINDLIQVDLEGGHLAPLTGRKLVVLCYGPDAKTVVKVISDQQLDCELFILSYNRCPNALVNHMERYLDEDVDVLVVDQNCDAKIMGPVITDLKRKLRHPRNWFWAECSPEATYIPYGYGENLFQASDLVESLQNLGIIEGGEARPAARTRSVKFRAVEEAPPAAAAPAAGGDVVVVKAPMDGEGVYITFHKKVGDAVNKGDVLAEVESDKATIEVEAPCAGRNLISQEVSPSTWTEVSR